MDPQEIFQQIRQMKLGQAELGKERFTASSGPVKVIVDGLSRVKEIKTPKSLTPENMKALKAALNNALKKAQKHTVKLIGQISR